MEGVAFNEKISPLVKLSATHFLIQVRTNQADLAVSNKSRAD
jgi:hypothetical protein